ncbi:hypothetical protein PENSPDRAFT_50987 [Peniophora sp. CONT]|nr:hypothetical protein PENSPDRAFT_50987 [Peniophora sp. CONT]
MLAVKARLQLEPFFLVIPLPLLPALFPADEPWRKSPSFPIGGVPGVGGCSQWQSPWQPSLRSSDIDGQCYATDWWQLRRLLMDSIRAFDTTRHAVKYRACTQCADEFLSAGGLSPRYCIFCAIVQTKPGQ